MTFRTLLLVFSLVLTFLPASGFASIGERPVVASSALASSKSDAETDERKLLWQCGCGEVQLEMTGDPYFNLDCHCSACTPIAKYLDGKSSDKEGISAVVHDTGTAKAFYLLNTVKFLKGKDKIAGVKLGPDGQNVRSYTTCCNTLLVGDSPVPFPFRSFNRHGMLETDGSKYVPKEEPWGVKGGENPWWDSVPEPKHPGDPDWLIEKVEAAESAGNVGEFAGDPLPGLFPDPDKIAEFVPKA